jgi:hypothetical protein
LLLIGRFKLTNIIICIRADRVNGFRGGIITYIHKLILYNDTTQTTQSLFPNDATIETQSIRIKTDRKQHKINLGNIYIPLTTSITYQAITLPARECITVYYYYKYQT